jgi:DnaJ like chaperone protein
MGLGKWIGGIVGFMAAGPLGALAGYAIGSMFENKDEDNYSGGGYGGRTTYESPGYGQRNSADGGNQQLS